MAEILVEELLGLLDSISEDMRQDGEGHEDIEDYARAIRAIDALHQPDREPDGLSPTVWCKACVTGWPCPTARALGR